MEPQTFLYIIGNVLFILGLILGKSRVESWYTVFGIGVWQVILLVLYAIGINCLVTGGCDRYAWAIAIVLVVMGSLAFLAGLQAVATAGRQQEPRRRG